MTNSGKIVIGILAGTALGSMLGVLFAPEKGRKTRAIIANKGKELGDASVEAYSKTKDLLGIKNDKRKELANN